MKKQIRLADYFSTTAILQVCEAAGAALGVATAGSLVRKKLQPEKEHFTPLDMAAACTFVCAVVCGLGSVLLRKEGERLAEPITKVTDATEKIAHGDFSVQLEQDETTKKVAELSALIENFNKMAAELQGMDYMRQDFMSNVSHEIKTPIAAIAGFTELLQDPNLPDRDRADYADMVHSQAIHLSELCENMLTMSRLTNQEIVVRNEAVQVDEQIRKAAILLLEKWSDKDLEFDLDLPKMATVTDPGLLEQVWNNLLDNAMKYSPSGSTIHVTGRVLDACRMDRAGSASNAGGRTTQVLQVAIRDEGPGIAPEKLSKVFDQFYQCEESHKSMGHGLGLSITRRIMELLGGNVSVDSTVGDGTTFTVTL